MGVGMIMTVMDVWYPTVDCDDNVLYFSYTPDTSACTNKSDTIPRYQKETPTSRKISFLAERPFQRHLESLSLLLPSSWHV